MGYVPKYIQKRMFPADAIKKVGDAIEMKVINVITSLSADLAPTGNILDYLHVKFNGKEIAPKEMKTVTVTANGITATLGDFSKLGVIAVGSEAIFTFVSEETKKAQPGDNITIEVTVPEVGVNITLERKLI